MKFWFSENFKNPIIVNNNGVFKYNDTFDPKDADINPVDIYTEDMPSEWASQVYAIQDRILNGSSIKEVAHWDFKFKGLSPVGWLKEQAGDGRFIVELDNGHLLYGNSPELVLEKNGNNIKLEILGGTDEWNEKTTEEHSLIIDDVIKRFPNELSIHQTKLIDIGYVKHLKTKLTGNWDYSLESIVPYIWPNLAIYGNGCGENYWGGLIGWGDETYAKLWLCIRCGIWDGEWHHYRVGCGITSKSDPESEWKELNKKLGWVLTS